MYLYVKLNWGANFLFPVEGKDCMNSASYEYRNLENHCIFILVELKRNQSFRYVVTGIEFWVANDYRLLSFFVFAAKSFFRSFLAALMAQYR